MTNDNSIRDDELLYRRINDNDDKHPDRHCSDENGNLKKISVICFHDGKGRISVFRAELMNSNPYLCRINTTQGVVGLTVSDALSVEINGYEVKVCAESEDTADCEHNSDEYFRRIAHAIIFIKRVDSDPPYGENKAFIVLKQGLKKSAMSRGWLLKPHA